MCQQQQQKSELIYYPLDLSQTLLFNFILAVWVFYEEKDHKIKFLFNFNFWCLKSEQCNNFKKIFSLTLRKQR